jgi:hypothetical protein
MTDPETVLYVAWLGLFLQGRLTEADVHFRRALSADPQHRDNLEEFAYHLNIRVSIMNTLTLPMVRYTRVGAGVVF